MRIRKWIFCWLFCLGTVLGAAEPAAARFGFSGPEIFKIDNQIGHLRAADIDGDGLQDLLIVNNARSKINLLYNQTGKTNEPPAARPVVKREINELPTDARFRLESVASEKRIASFVVADLNGDNRPDIAYYGEPKELVVQYNEGSKTWGSPKRWGIQDGQININGLVHGDLNGDKRTDLVLLAENHLYLLAQKSDHTLGEPEKIPFSGSVKGLQILDIDGDGLDDLLLVNWESSNPVRIRLQHSGGLLGPEIHFSLPPIRAYWADDLDGDHKTEMITIAQNSGRAQISNFILKPAEPILGMLHAGQFQVIPINKTSKARRGSAWADINQDQRQDLLVAEPDSGQLTVFLQQQDGDLAAPKVFPTLTAISEIAAGDWDNDGDTDIFLLSADERQVGITALDEKGRVPFPAILPLDGRPLAMALGRLQEAGPMQLSVVVEANDQRSLQVRSADGETMTQPLNSSFKSNPSSMAIHDIDQDGLADLVILIPYEKVKVLRQKSGGGFEELDIAPPGGNAEQPWLSVADIDGDGKGELLLAQKNFIRAVVLKRDSASGNGGSWSFGVKEQINGASSNSRIVGAAGLSNGVSPVVSLILLDVERKSLTLCERDAAGVWQVVRNLEVPVTDFNELQVVALGGNRPNTIALIGLNAIAWMAFRGQTWSLLELDGYETPIKDGFLIDVVSGDLNQDGRKDLVFVEGSKNYLDLVTFEPPHELVPADRWPVFEERTFRSRRAEGAEPREALVIDLTGDGRNDLAIVVHDRILVYPQESAPTKLTTNSR